MVYLRVKGIAFICFTADDSNFYGILSADAHHAGSSYTLRGKESTAPLSHFHQCCFETTPKFYELVIRDETKMEFEQNIVIKHVMRLGGDNCSLVVDDCLEFTTDQLLAGQTADSYIEKYFPSSLKNKDCYICIGDMSVDYSTESVDSSAVL